MRLSPLDIRKQEFGRSLRGLNPEEVTSFLQMLSIQWDELLSEQRQLEQRVRELESKLEHYQNVEEALQEALRTARESSRQALESAKQQALDIIREAERRGDEMKRSAELERIGLRKEANDALMRRNEIAARLRAFLHSELELLSRFEGEYLDRRPVSVSPDTSDLSRDRSRGGDDYRDQAYASEGPAIDASQVRGSEVGEDATHAEHAQMQHGTEVDFEDAGKVEDRRQDWSAPEITASFDRKSPANTPGTSSEEYAEGRPGVREEPRTGSGFVVRPVFGGASPPKPLPADERVHAEPESEEADPYTSSASSDEIERIRRILKDLE